jgi:hypothetical protein
MPPAVWTVTVVVPPVTFGAVLLAVMIADPAVIAVIGTFTEAAPCGIVTEAGTEATDALLDVSATTTPPAGAAAERLSATFWVPAPDMTTFGVAKLSVAPT